MFYKKKVSKILQNSQENHCARVYFLIMAASCEYYEVFKNTFFYRTPPVAASVKISVPAIFDYTWYHRLPLRCDIIVVKRYPQKNDYGGVHPYCSSNFKTFKLKKKHFVVICIQVFLHSQSGWGFEIVFWMIWVLRTRLYLTFVKRK